uniref:Cytochrome c oxidase assembly protein ctaG n=1 Tax=Reclinomonas americana TaxID=48483 RepID=COXZ_RECAM|nr:component involved in Haem biosynthesis [Reclinomonas americana]O21243.1 RecName: Full=Cytochrome c oxidase assembly protein ctaG [Reclinomonas americana]AAD11870.1 component involved in Haem biosynthesis [Reclinomonas americana]
MFKNRKSIAILIAAVSITMIGFSYGSVPLYRIFCQVTGFGGTTQVADLESDILTLKDEQQENRIITVRFNGDVSDTMPWKFHPIQQEIKVMVGETALAFYSAENPTDSSIIGISTYNVNPQQAGIYFNKIQCFCFEEQRLKPHETIDMPVFFFIDPAILDDPKMSDIDSITLSYTFFNVEDL